MNNPTYHIPVLLQASIDGLNIKPTGIYVDVTFGGGGHSAKILSLLKGGQLIGIDQDPDAAKNSFSDPQFKFIACNFKYVLNYLKLHKITQIDGLIADLGVSSHQFDTAQRGFSFRFNAPLNMRMDKQEALNAIHVLNEYTAEALHKMFGIYGEITNAKTLANAIVLARNDQKIETVDQLKEIAERCKLKTMKHSQYYAQIFQAIRIEVNQEMDALKALLEQSAQLIKPGGRLVVLSYHSLEDRLVKNFIQKGKFYGNVEKDFFGNDIKPFKAVVQKAGTASAEEIVQNSRARSAKLRIAEKI